MKILYGIQGTGNGHISRAREMAKCFANRNVDVDYVFSGRAAEQYFDMEPFGDFRTFQGLTFASKNGRLSYTRTALSNNILRFGLEVRSIHTAAYDFILTDFEPITAWAGKLKGCKVIGLGHQYAFGHPIPRAGDNFISNLTMRLFAPAQIKLGLHWDNFGAPILPPIIDTTLTHRFSCQTHTIDRTKADNIIVYLPFENQDYIQQQLSCIEDQKFIIYSPDLEDQEIGNLSLRKTSHDGFKKDLCSSYAVISNSGFELISECLQLGLSILTKPQFAQTEQMSNAAALKQLGYAETTEKIDTQTVRKWLRQLQQRPPIKLPNVASAITEWLLSGQRESPQELAAALWAQT